jgi:hypothetical protein
VEKYFNQALKSFFDYQKQFEEQFRQTHGLPSMFSPVAAWTKAMLQPFATVFRSPEESAPQAPPAAAPTSNEEPAGPKARPKSKAGLRPKGTRPGKRGKK